jgi:TolA-binding protein
LRRAVLRLALLGVLLPAVTPAGVSAVAWAAEQGFTLIPAAAAAEMSPSRPSDRQSVFGRVNPGGPENWPEDQGLSTAGIPTSAPGEASPADAGGQAVPLPAAGGAAQQAAGQPQPDAALQQPAAPQQNPPQSPAPPPQSVAAEQPSAQPQPVPAQPQASAPPAAPQASPAAGAASAAGTPAVQDGGRHVSAPVSDTVVGVPGEAPKPAAEEKPPRPVIYVDEQGNPVPKPMDPAALLADVERLMAERKYEEALPQLEELKNEPALTPEQRERVLYAISDCIWAQYADNPVAGFEPIVASTSEAMNANLRSLRVPDALLRLGLANVNVGNLADAGGYIVALYRRYPDFPGVAQGFTALGKEQARQRQDARAEQSFSIVLDKYPESSYLQEASVGLARALAAQKKFDKAHVILDFISKRWPRYYIDDPSFILLQADNEEARKEPLGAIALYWLYYNLVPGQEGNDAMLFKMADMYSTAGNAAGADFLYNFVQRRYPGTPPATRAGLRLAEGGIYDSPVDYETMSRVFASRTGVNLSKVYTDLAAASQTAPDSVLARLKEAMWLYWSKRYTEAMGMAADFIDGYPENPNVPQARDIIWMAFRKELANSMAEKNYGRILILWNGFPLVRERYGNMDPAMRFALAQGLMERGEESGALSMLAGFLKPTMDPDYGEAAFTEFFNRYLKAGQWGKILDLGKLVAGWPMNPQLRNQLDYAMALSAQNLNLSGPALAMWRKLADKKDIPLYQRAYATYFLARDAEARKDIRDAYTLNLKVIELFTLLQDERSDKADPQRIKDAMVALMDICEVGNRIPEALEWVRKYSAYAPPDSPEYPGLRFREARLYRKLGDASRAQALLENLARKYPDSPFGKAAAAELRTFEVSRDLQSYMPGGSGSPQAGTAGPQGAAAPTQGNAPQPAAPVQNGAPAGQ